MDFDEFSELPEGEQQKLVARATASYDQTVELIKRWAMENPVEWHSMLEMIMTLQAELAEDNDEYSRVIDLAWIGHKFIAGKILGIEM